MLVTTGTIKKIIIENQIVKCLLEVDVFKTSDSDKFKRFKKNEYLKSYITALPGVSFNYNVNDLVWVMFKNNLADEPVILGQIFKTSNDNKASSINLSCNKLSVGQCNLSAETTKLNFGNIQNKLNLTTLKSITDKENSLKQLYKSIDSKIAAAKKWDTDNPIKPATEGIIELILGDNYLQWPVLPVADYSAISSPFGPRVINGVSEHHNGIDIVGSIKPINGVAIRAAADGTVSQVYNNCKHNYGKTQNCGCADGYGNYCSITHNIPAPNNITLTFVSYYAHAREILVKPNETVSRGQIIGYVGSTGFSTGPHLHFGITYTKKQAGGPTVSYGWIDPQEHLAKK